MIEFRFLFVGFDIVEADRLKSSLNEYTCGLVDEKMWAYGVP